MTDVSNLQKLKPRERKGSKPRCHWLTHGTREQVAKRLTELAKPYGSVSPDNCWMPEGFCNIEEARLETACNLLPNVAERDELRDWWLQVPRSANTPNWDIAGTCSIDGQDGFLLVEAKAHTGELTVKDKTQAGPKNLQKIVDAIQQANDALSGQTDLSWALSHKCRFQMSNRFAWSWKLAQLGYPVVLAYLGFLNANEMKRETKRHDPFQNHTDWTRRVKEHSRPLFPEEVWDTGWNLHGKLFVPRICSREVSYDAPME